jgi:hypothetical protein
MNALQSIDLGAQPTAAVDTGPGDASEPGDFQRLLGDDTKSAAETYENPAPARMAMTQSDASAESPDGSLAAQLAATVLEAVTAEVGPTVVDELPDLAPDQDDGCSDEDVTDALATVAQGNVWNLLPQLPSDTLVRANSNIAGGDAYLPEAPPSGAANEWRSPTAGMQSLAGEYRMGFIDSGDIRGTHRPVGAAGEQPAATKSDLLSALASGRRDLGLFLPGDPTNQSHDPREVMSAESAGKPTVDPRFNTFQLANMNNTEQATASPVGRSLATPVHHPRWADAIAQELQWCVDNGVQRASLRLSPEHLGPVEIRLSLDEGRVNINFSATQAETRAALEQSLPRLRELFAGAGLNLGDAQVQQQARRSSQNQFGSAASAADTEGVPAAQSVLSRLGLVDEYA